MSKLDLAINIASKAHLGQLDKAGAPYILHPLRVMMRMDTDDLRIIAVLHDVIEDTSVTLNDLKYAGFSEEIIDAIAALTKIQGESYGDFIKRASQNALARQVKIADLTDNLDVTRFYNPEDLNLERIQKYISSLTYLRRM